MMKRSSSSSKRDGAAHFNIPQLLKFREEDFLKLTGSFSSSNIIGRGSFSTVYKGLLPSGLEVAVRKLDFTRESQAAVQKSFFTELHVLAKIRHRNILPVLGYFSNVDTMAVIVTFMPRGTLQSKLQQRHSYICLDWSKRYRVALGVAEALAYIHHSCKQQVVHCHLNPANILLNDDYEAHLSNFGFAKMVDQQMRTVEGYSQFLWCPGYTAPELFSGERPSPAADVYSFGVVLLELLTRKSPTSVEFRDGVTLREWSKTALDHGNWTSVLDMQLQQEILSQGEMLAVLEMAISCCDELPAARPSMKAVTGFLVRLKDHGHFARFNKPINVLIQEKPFDWVLARKQKPCSTSSFTLQTESVS